MEFFRGEKIPPVDPQIFLTINKQCWSLFLILHFVHHLVDGGWKHFEEISAKIHNN